MQAVVLETFEEPLEVKQTDRPSPSATADGGENDDDLRFFDDEEP